MNDGGFINRGVGTVEKSPEELEPSLKVKVHTATVSTDEASKQALLPAVPVGKVRVITDVILRNASASLGAMASGVGIGYNVAADDVLADSSEIPFASLTTSSMWTSLKLFISCTAGTSQTSVLGEAGDILGIIFYSPLIEATLDIDVFYYDIDV